MAKLDPDGQRLALTSITFVIHAAAQEIRPFDPIEGLTLVSRVADGLRSAITRTRMIAERFELFTK